MRITLRVYAHWLPGSSGVRAVDLLDDTPPSATQTQPVTQDREWKNEECCKCLRQNGEPRRNRTFNPQIKSLLLCQLS
jgi:hypothetical protein